MAVIRLGGVGLPAGAAIWPRVYGGTQRTCGWLAAYEGGTAIRPCALRIRFVAERH